MGQIGHLSNSSQVSYSYLNSLKCSQISGRQMQELKSLPYMSFWSNNSVVTFLPNVFTWKTSLPNKALLLVQELYCLQMFAWRCGFKCSSEIFYTKMNNYRYKTCRGTVSHLSKLSHRPLSMGVITINTWNKGGKEIILLPLKLCDLVAVVIYLFVWIPVIKIIEVECFDFLLVKIPIKILKVGTKIT